LAEEVESRNREKIKHQLKQWKEINKNTTNGGAAMTNRRLNL